MPPFLRTFSSIFSPNIFPRPPYYPIIVSVRRVGGRQSRGEASAAIGKRGRRFVGGFFRSGRFMSDRVGEMPLASATRNASEFTDVSWLARSV
jgi:hypothetical protein